MDRKKILISLTLVLAGCSSKPGRLRSEAELKESLPIASPLPPPLSKNPHEALSELHSDNQVPSNPAITDEVSRTNVATVRKRNFGVWIDGVGLESMAALGFLQELEKSSYKPRKIVGVGFGCWVALSWALQNNGNQAEWQAFKWTDWNAIGSGRGLLGRLTSGGRNGFEAEVRRLLPAKNVADFKLPVDCPLFEKKPPFKTVSGRSMPLANMLWAQFQLPTLGIDPDASESEFYSGALGPGPLPRELDEMARDISGDDDFGGWIVLRTRAPGDRSPKQNWPNLMSSRADQLMLSSGITPQSSSYVVLDLSDGNGRSPEQTKNFENRRRWILEGRRRANIVLKGDAFKKFLQGSGPN